MDKVDLSILRLAAYEVLHCHDVPRSVAINEAIELAKEFSGEESASFVNGLLDQLAPERREQKAVPAAVASPAAADASNGASDEVGASTDTPPAAEASGAPTA